MQCLLAIDEFLLSLNKVYTKVGADRDRAKLCSMLYLIMEGREKVMDRANIQARLVALKNKSRSSFCSSYSIKSKLS